MNPDSAHHAAALAAAEEVLRHIYGDDFTGCTVSLESVASVIARVFDGFGAQQRELLEVHEKATEAIHLLSTPPINGKNLTPPELQSLLGDRLDSIHALTGRILQATGSLREQDPAAGGEE